MPHSILILLFAIAMCLGVAGSVVPVLPGIPLMLALAVAFGFLDGFRHLTGWELLPLVILTIAGLATDALSGMLGARYGGASRRSTLFGFLGLLIGMAVFPPFGGIGGLFLGVLAAEMAGHRNRERALRAASGSLLGAVTGIAIGTFLSILFLILFVLLAWR